MEGSEAHKSPIHYETWGGKNLCRGVNARKVRSTCVEELVTCHDCLQRLGKEPRHAAE